MVAAILASGKRKTFAQSVKQHYTRIRRQLTELSKAAGPAWQLRDNSASPCPESQRRFGNSRSSLFSFGSI
jgi:hypothetical protein